MEPIQAQSIQAEPIQVEQTQAGVNDEIGLLSQDDIIDLGFAKEEVASAMEEETVIPKINEIEKKRSI